MIDFNNELLRIENKYKNSKITLKNYLSSSNKHPERERNFKSSLIKIENTAINELILKNIDKLLQEANFFIDLYGKDVTLNSGYRPAEDNIKIGGAKNSLHTLGLAIDFLDKTGEIDEFMVKNVNLLKEHNCAIEHPYYTKIWCHFQAQLPASKKNIFVPYSSEPNVFHVDNKFKDLVI